MKDAEGAEGADGAAMGVVAAGHLESERLDLVSIGVDSLQVSGKGEPPR